MRYFALPDGVIDQKDRAQWLTTPFDSIHGALSVSQAITLISSVSEFTIHHLSITQSITLSQSESISPKLESSTQSITLSQSVSVSTIHNVSVSQSITLADSLSRQVIYNRTETDAIILNYTVDEFKGNLHQTITQSIDLNQQPFKSVDIGGQIIHIPTVDVVVKPRKCLVVLGCKDLNVVLPCPQFGDSESNVGVLNVKRTMTGQTYIYSKGSNLRKLSYRFLLQRDKAFELQNFLKQYMSELVYVTDWKGQKWLTYITNNPIDLIYKGLWRLCGEYIEVKLDFEGTKIFG